MRTAEESRDAERLKLEMERRHTEHLRREALLQTSRDEISSAAQEAQREMQARIAGFDPVKHGYTELAEWNTKLEALCARSSSGPTRNGWSWPREPGTGV